MWTDLAKDSLLLAGRIGTIFPLLMVIGLFMGKRSLGELSVFDFLVIHSMGSVVGADLAQPNVNHIHIATAILLIAVLQRIVSLLSIKWRRFGKFTSFEPTVVVHQGNLLVHNLKKARYSIDNILQLLREKDIFHLADVELAVLEANGRLTVYKKSPKPAPILEELGLAKQQSDLSYSLIVEGTVYQNTLDYIRKDSAWLDSQLRARGVCQDDIFYASVDDKGTLYISDTSLVNPPPVRH